jgi:predicted HTH domain antitoxin
MLSITLDVPNELSTPLSISGYNQEKLTEEAKRLLAVSLFERNILSLGQAAKLAELHLWDFIRLLSQQDIPIAAYDDEEIEQELKAVECLIEQTK